MKETESAAKSGGAATSPRFLVAIAIRSVQRTISESIRTADLACSSSAVSRIVGAMCKVIVADGTKLIAPYLPVGEGGEVTNSGQEHQSMPNRVVFQHQEPETAAKKAISAANQLWKNWAPKGINPEDLDITWVAVPSIGTEAEQFEALGKQLDSRKRLSVFAQPSNWSSAGNPGFTICSLTGRAPAVPAPNEHFAKRFGNSDVSAEIWTKRYSKQPSQSADETNLFPSTATFAVSSWMLDVFEAAGAPSRTGVSISHLVEFTESCRVLASAFNVPAKRMGASALPAVIETARRGASELEIKAFRDLAEIEGRWILTDELDQKTVAEQLLASATVDPVELDRRGAALKMFRQARRDLLLACEKANIARPPIYLALVALDGDSVGKKLSELSSFEKISEVSKTLAQTGGKLRKTLEANYCCRVIYAGGDDLFAISSGRDAISVVTEARRMISTELGTEGVSGAHLDGVTASGAVVWMHYSAPLQSGVRNTQAFLREAKEVNQAKDRLGLAVHRRGGLRAKLTFPFAESDVEEQGNSAKFKYLVEVLAKSELSSSLISDLERNADRHMIDSKGSSELLRFLTKRHGNAALTEPVAEALWRLSEFPSNRPSRARLSNANSERLRVCSEVLQVARFLSAEVPPRTTKLLEGPSLLSSGANTEDNPFVPEQQGASS